MRELPGAAQPLAGRLATLLGLVFEATGGYDAMWLLDLTLAAIAAGIALTIPERSAPAVSLPAVPRTAGTPA